VNIDENTRDAEVNMMVRSLMSKKEETRFSLEQLNRNIRIFQITGIDVTVLLVPVIVIIWLQAGVSFSEMVLLQGIFMLPILLLEVPSGSFADYWSRKGCVVLFHLIFGTGIFFYAIGDSFVIFAVAELLAGVGVSLKTGSDSALVYDSLKTHYKDTNGRFGKLIANRMTIMFVGSAIGAVFGGYLASFPNFLRLPVYIAFLGHYVFAGVALFGYTEPSWIQAESPKAAIITAVNSLKKKELQYILVVAISATVFTSIGFWASQHTLVHDFSVNPFELGIILAVFNICAGLSSYIIKRNISNLTKSHILFVILLIDGVYIFGLIPVSSLASVIIISLIGQVTRGSRTPITQSIMQINLSSTERATFNSLVSFISSGMYFLFSNILAINEFSRAETLTVGFVGILIGITIFILLGIRKIRVRGNYPAVRTL
jgi:MFS family permease